jgi:hypothetical protein
MSFCKFAKARLDATTKSKISGSSSPMPNAGSNACIVSSTEDRFQWDPELVKPTYVRTSRLFLFARVRLP